MIERHENLERLVSRYLDGECSVAERRQLQALIRKDADAEAFFEETAALDREIGQAMRAAVVRPPLSPRGHSRWFRIVRVAALSAAACAAWLVFRPNGSLPRTHQSGDARPKMASWFSPPPVAGDSLSENSAVERPEVLLNQANRQWIVVPGERPGEFMIVEVKCVKSRAIPMQGDF